MRNVFIARSLSHDIADGVTLIFVQFPPEHPLRRDCKVNGKRTFPNALGLQIELFLNDSTRDRIESQTRLRDS